MQEERKTKADRLQESDTLCRRVCGLKQAAEEWSGTFDATSDLVFVQDKDFKFVKVTKSFCDLLKVKPGDLIEKKCYEVLHKSDKPWPNCPLAKALKDKRPHTEEVYDPNIGIPLLITASPLFDENGELTTVVHIATDITKRKKAREVLRTTELRYRTLFESIPIGIGLATVEGQILDWNSGMLEMTGYSDAEIRHINLNDTYHNPKQRAVLLQQLQTDGLVRDFEVQLRRKDGTTYWASLTITPFPLGDETVLLTVALDITERKMAEAAQWESEEQHRAIFEGAVDGIIYADRKGNVIEVNSAFTNITGIPREEVVGKNATSLAKKFAKPKYVPHLLKAISQMLKGIPIKLYELEINDKIVEVSTPVLDMEATGITGIIRDITERKKVEKAEQESEEKYRKLFEETTDAIFVADPKTGIITDCNRAAAELVGRERSELIGEHQRILHPPEEIEREFSRTFKQHLKEKEGQVLEAQVIAKKGQIKDVAIKASRFELKGEERIQAMFRDITERKRAEDELKESEQRFRAIFDNAADGILLADVEGKRFHTANKMMYQMLGCNLEEIKNLGVVDIHPGEDLPHVIEEFEKQSQEEFTLSRDIPVKRRDGSFFYADINSIPITLRGKRYLMSIFRDITEHKQLEDTLRESEEKYRTLVESAPESIAIVNEDGVFLFMSETGARRLGGKPADYVGKTMWDLFPKETADRQAASVRKVINTGEGMNVVVLTELQGEPRWYNTTVEPLRDGSGKVTTAMIVARDIHELRQAEEQVRKLSTAVEQSIDGIAIGDLEPKLLYVNNAFARMHGYTPQEMIGMPVTKLFNKEQMDEYKRAVNQQKTQDFWEGEIGHIRKDGTAFPTYVSVTLLQNNEGKPTGTLAVVRDITESKRREEELSTYRENMVRAEELATAGTLSATLAHELTQPLTVIGLAIGNSLAELETMSCPANVVEDLKEGLSEISNMTSMVDRFRNFARMSTKRTVSEVDFRAIAERIVKLLDESAWRAKVALHVDGMSKLPLIYSYQRDLEQLFFSLVENAIQAADGKKKRQVVISGTVRDEYIELQFSDNCGGIAPEQTDRIFEPFFTTKRAAERTGLGLCVVKRIVFQLGGKVRVESKLNKGSTFFVTLPIIRGGRRLSGNNKHC